MGAGHLNARRSVQQFESGEYNPGTVSSIAWDYHGVGNIEEYVFDSQIGPGYIAATLAWDRRVDKTGGSTYLEGDNFVIEDPEDRLNNLDLYLMPAASNNFADAITKSISTVQNLEHIFFNIETAGQYKLVVHNNPVGGIGDTQAYALAWWFGDAPSDLPGDYDGNGSVGPEDYNVWRTSFGSTNSMADGNGNGVVDAADYVIWRKNTTAGSGSLAAVSEPSGLMLIAVVSLFICRVGRLCRVSA
jgi:hypothetical protein